MGEIKEALGVLAFGACNESMKTFNRDVFKQQYRDYLREYLTVLQCTSAYPTPEDEVNLRCLTTLEENFEIDVGFSDHTLNVHTPALAVARGAGVVEKHFTLDRSMEGPDHAASLEPGELAQMIDAVSTVPAALR